MCKKEHDLIWEVCILLVSTMTHDERDMLIYQISQISFSHQLVICLVSQYKITH